MPKAADPTVQRRRLRAELRGARLAAGRTQKEVAEALDWSPSKLLRIETGSVSISTTDLRALLDQYGITDPDRIAALVAMAQNAKKQPWSAYKSVLAREFLVYLGFEGSASIIRNFEPLLVPGLLQTEEYAETIIRTYATGEDSQSVVEMRVQARLERQEILTRTNPPQTFFILDEAVIHRWVGGSEVMRQQLEHLKSVSELPNVSIQVLPYEAGAHPGMTGAFVLLEFADPADDDVLYLEDARGDMVTRDDPIDTAEFVNTFWELERISTRPDRLDQIIDRVLREIETSGPGSSV